MIVNPKDEKLVVEVSTSKDRRPGEETPEPDNLGLLPSPYRRRRVFPRKTKAGYIIPYDLGRLSAGGSRMTGILFEDYDPPGEGVDELRNYYNAPLSIPLAEWATTFRKITKAEEGYRFRLNLYADSSPVNTGHDLIAPGNEKWKERGYQVDGVFNGLSIGDPNYILETLSFTSDPSSKRTTLLPDPMAPNVEVPELDPKNGNIHLFISPAVLKVMAEQPVPPIDFDPPGPASPTSYPQGYNLIDACPALPNGPSIPDWNVALIQASAFSDSGSVKAAESHYATALDREDAFVTPLGRDNFDTINGDALNYLDRAMEFDYEVTTYSRAGSGLSFNPKEHGPPEAPYIGRNYLCLGGQRYPVANGVGGTTLFTTNSSNTSPSGPFPFNDTYGSQAFPLLESITSNSNTGEGGALLCAINQGSNWFFVWHVNRFFIP